MPAIERYNGPAFQVVRRFLRQSPAEPLDIQIVSARAGLIAATTPVPYYDQRMTRSQALALQNQVTTALAALIQTHHYQDVCFCMGKDAVRRVYLYSRLLPGYGFPIGLDIADKYAHVPAWLTDAYSKLIRYHLTASLQRGEITDAEMRRILTQAIYMTHRDWLLRPQS